MIAGVIAITDFIKSLRQAESLEEQASRIKVIAATSDAGIWIAVRIWRSCLVHIGVDIQVASHIADVSDLSGEGRSEPMLHGKVPRIRQWNAERIWRTEEVIDVQISGQGESSRRASRRNRGQRRSGEQIEDRRVVVILIELLRKDDGRIVIRSLAKHRA